MVGRRTVLAAMLTMLLGSLGAWQPALGNHAPTTAIDPGEACAPIEAATLPDWDEQATRARWERLAAATQGACVLPSDPTGPTGFVSSDCFAITPTQDGRSLCWWPRLLEHEGLHLATRVTARAVRELTEEALAIKDARDFVGPGPLVVRWEAGNAAYNVKIAGYSVESVEPTNEPRPEDRQCRTFQVTVDQCRDPIDPLPIAPDVPVPSEVMESWSQDSAGVYATLVPPEPGECRHEYHFPPLGTFAGGILIHGPTLCWWGSPDPPEPDYTVSMGRDAFLALVNAPDRAATFVYLFQQGYIAVRAEDPVTTAKVKAALLGLDIAGRSVDPPLPYVEPGGSVPYAYNGKPGRLHPSPTPGLKIWNPDDPDEPLVVVNDLGSPIGVVPPAPSATAPVAPSDYTVIIILDYTPGRSEPPPIPGVPPLSDPLSGDDTCVACADTGAQSFATASASEGSYLAGIANHATYSTFLTQQGLISDPTVGMAGRWSA